MYEYNAEVKRVVDGDTVHFLIDLGLDVKLNCTCRLWGINAPEMNTQQGKDSKAFLTALLARRTQWRIKTFKDKKEKYGRYLVSIYDPMCELPCLNDAMISAGQAVRYMDT